MQIHHATRGFERSTRAYDRGRPEYLPQAAEEILDRTLVHSSSRVLELGAGTGKFTRLLANRTSHVVASDPSPAMRRALREKTPQVRCLAAQAEHIPTVAATFDVVLCAQAFHWFGNSDAVGEIHRVLVPGGHLGLIWNVRDEEVEWIRALTAIMDPYSGDTPRYRSGEWKAALAGESQWAPLQHVSFRHTVSCDRATVQDRVGSISFIAALDEARHRAVLEAVGTLLDTHPETRGRLLLDFPYRTDLYWCRKQ